MSRAIFLTAFVGALVCTALSVLGMLSGDWPGALYMIGLAVLNVLALILGELLSMVRFVNEMTKASERVSAIGTRCRP